MWPNWTLNTFPGPAHVRVLVFHPLDAERTATFVDGFWAPGTSEEAIEEITEFGGVVGAEDVALVESVHRGLRSNAIEQGRLLLDSEHLIQHFQLLVHDAAGWSEGQESESAEAASSRAPRSSRASGQSSVIANENPTRSSGQQPWVLPPEPVCPKRWARRTEPHQLRLQLEAGAEGVRSPRDRADPARESSTRPRRTVASERSRTPSSSPPWARQPYRRAIERASPIAFAPGISARWKAGSFQPTPPREDAAVDGSEQRLRPVAEVRDPVVGGRREARDAALLLLGEADPEVEPERRSDLLREEAPDAAAVDAADEAVAEPAVGERVVGDLRAGLPERRLRRLCAPTCARGRAGRQR